MSLVGAEPVGPSTRHRPLGMRSWTPPCRQPRAAGQPLPGASPVRQPNCPPGPAGGEGLYGAGSSRPAPPARRTGTWPRGGAPPRMRWTVGGNGSPPQERSLSVTAVRHTVRIFSGEPAEEAWGCGGPAGSARGCRGRSRRCRRPAPRYCSRPSTLMKTSSGCHVSPGLGLPAARRACAGPPGRAAPAADRLVGDDDPALGRELLVLAERHREAVVQPHAGGWHRPGTGDPCHDSDALPREGSSRADQPGDHPTGRPT